MNYLQPFLEAYWEAKQNILNYFDLDSEWIIYEIQDRRDCAWKIEGNEVLYGDIELKGEDIQDKNCYSAIVLEAIRKREFSLLKLKDGERKFLVIFCNLNELKQA